MGWLIHIFYLVIYNRTLQSIDIHGNSHLSQLLLKEFALL